MTTQTKTLQKFEIADIDTGDVYLRRWSLLLPFGLTIKLHHILRPDGDRCQHDHPWRFVTFVLYGGYHEQHGANDLVHAAKPLRIYYRPAKFRHRITFLPKGHAWTIVVTGRRIRKWGFHTKSGWVHWKTFVGSAKQARVLWCKDNSHAKNDGGSA